ncbi:MAG: hypothetical protein C4321_05445 [Chloroflexota bacterium]
MESFGGGFDEAVEFAAACAGFGGEARGERDAHGDGAADAKGDVFVAGDAPNGLFDAASGLVRFEEVSVAGGAEGDPAEQPEGPVVGDAWAARRGRGEPAEDGG